MRSMRQYLSTTEEKFYKLVESGRIKVSDGETAESLTVQHTSQTAPRLPLR